MSTADSQNRDAKFIAACANVKTIKSNLSTLTPVVKPSVKNLDETYLTTHFSEELTKLPRIEGMQPYRVSLVYWYVKKYKCGHLFDPFMSKGETLIGSIISGCPYTGLNNYYPMQKPYNEIVSLYNALKTTQVLCKGNYWDILKARPSIDIVFTHIPAWEDACMALSKIWRYSNRDMLIVLHFSQDNSDHLFNVKRLVQTLSGRNIAIEHTYAIYNYETVMLLSRTDFFDLGPDIPGAVIKKSKEHIVYELYESCMFLCLDDYFKALSGVSKYTYVASGLDQFALVLANKLRGNLTIYNISGLSEWLAQHIVLTGAILSNDKQPPSSVGAISTNDPVYATCLYSVVDRCFPDSHPFRVWIELDNTTYLNTLLVKWPETTFLVCSRNYHVDLSMSLSHGPNRQGRVVVYQLAGAQKLDDYVGEYGLPSDSIIREGIKPRANALRR